MRSEKASDKSAHTGRAITVKVLFLGPAGDWAGRGEAAVSVAAGVTLGQLVERLYGEHPVMARARDSVRWAVNAEFAAMDTELRDGDEVAVIPPVSGGQPSRRARLTREPIDASALAAAVQHDRCGAVVTFLGTVRAEGNDDPLVALEYSAYEPMALAKLNEVCDEAASRFAVHEVACVHRVGRMDIGEASIAIAVSAAHRADAFEAARFVIEQVKQVVPIWKKELYRSGRMIWVDPTREQAEHGQDQEESA